MRIQDIAVLAGLVISAPTHAESRGSIDHVSSSGTISGWALETGTPRGSIDVFFTVDGNDTPAAGDFAGQVTAKINRMDVGPGKHGFVFQLPERFADGEPHTVRAYSMATGTPHEIGQVNVLPFGGHVTDEASLSPPPAL